MSDDKIEIIWFFDILIYLRLIGSKSNVRIRSLYSQVVNDQNRPLNNVHMGADVGLF